MPVIERRGRARLRNNPESNIAGMEQLRTVLASAHDDPDAWQEVRPRVVRYLARRVGDPKRALRIAEAYHNRPGFMPMRSPSPVLANPQPENPDNG